MTSPGVRSITRNTIYLALTQTAGIGVRLIWVVAAARFLGPDLYAVLAYSQAWQLAFLPLALFGIGPAMAYMIPVAREGVADIAADGLAIRIVTATVAAGACFMLSRVIVPDPRVPPLVGVLVLALVGRSLTAWAQSLFLAFEKNRLTMIQETVFGLLDLALALTILLGGGGLLALVGARAAVTWLQAGRTLFVAHRHILPLRLVWRPANWRPLFALALPALLITFAADWRLNGSLVLFRNLMDDGVLFGQYALAMQALAIASVLPVALSSAAYPVLRRSASRADGKDLLYASIVQRAALLAGSAAGLLGLTLGEPLFRLLFGESFATAGRLAGLTAWCLIPLAVAQGYPQVLIARGRFRAQVLAEIAGAALMTVLTVLLAPVYGVAGAIVAAFAGFTVLPLVSFWLVVREELASASRDLLRPLAAALSGIATYLALAPLSRIAALACGLSILVATAAVLRILTREEMRLLTRPAR